MEKCEFCGLLKAIFDSPEKLVCYTKRGKWFFYCLFSRSIPWGYKDYKGFQGVTGDYKKLQGVTGGYNKLQRVREEYRRLAFLTSTSPDTFSSSIMHKN